LLPPTLLIKKKKKKKKERRRRKKRRKKLLYPWSSRALRLQYPLISAQDGSLAMSS
jgi:hypothetical protein